MAYSPNNNPYIPGDPYSYDLKWMVDEVKSIEKAIPGYTSQLKNDSGFISGITDIHVPLRNRCDNSEPWTEAPETGINNWFVGSASNLSSYDFYDPTDENHMEFTAAAPHTLQIQKLVIDNGSYNGGADFSAINDGDTLIVSAEFKTSAEMDFSAGFVLVDNDGSHNFRAAKTITQAYTNDWKQLTVSAVVPSGWTERLNGSVTRLALLLLVTFKTTGQTIQVRHIFFGHGNVSADWQPSPADIIAQA